MLRKSAKPTYADLRKKADAEIGLGVRFRKRTVDGTYFVPKMRSPASPRPGTM